MFSKLFSPLYVSCLSVVGEEVIYLNYLELARLYIQKVNSDLLSLLIYITIRSLSNSDEHQVTPTMILLIHTTLSNLALLIDRKRTNGVLLVRLITFAWVSSFREDDFSFIYSVKGCRESCRKLFCQRLSSSRATRIVWREGKLLNRNIDDVGV